MIINKYIFFTYLDNFIKIQLFAYTVYYEKFVVEIIVILVQLL